MTASKRDQHGFTLVEVLLVVAILGIIGAALTESVIIGLRTTTATVDQVSGSIDRQQLATAFVPDVQSAQSVDGSACGPGGGTPVVTLSRVDRGVEKAATYVHESAAEGPRLLRRYCEAGVLVQQVIADHLGQPPPTVDCASAPPTCTLTVHDTRAVRFEVSATRRST